MITNDQQLEQAEQAAATIKALLRQSRRTMPREAYARMARAWLLDLQEREREILLYLSGLEVPEQAVQATAAAG
jgi:hypothetical protein